MQLTGLALPWKTKARRKTPRFLVPVMPGYVPDSPDTINPWRRRRRYIALAFAAFLYGFFYALLPPAFLSILLIPIAVLTFLIIWALPVTDRAPGKAMDNLFWAFWLSLMLWPNYLALALPGLPWITVNRLFGGPLLLLLLIATSTSRPFRNQMSAMLSATPWLWKMVVAFAVSGFFSSFFSSEIFATLNKFVNLQIVWTSIFFASVWVFRKPGAITMWTRIFVMMAIVTSIIGLFEARQQQILWADSIPSFLKVEDPAVQRLLDGTFRFDQYRVAATTMSPLSFAEFLALSTPFLIHFALTSQRVAVWLLLLAADALIFVAILNTDARLGMVGFFFTHAILGLFYAIRAWRGSKTSLFGPAITLAYPAMLAVFIVLVFSIGRLRVLVMGDGSANVSSNAREAQFEAMWPVLFKSPILGYGTGQGGPKLGFSGAGGSIVTVDSYIISIALDFGIIGFFLFYGLVVGGIVKTASLAIKPGSGEGQMAIPLVVCMATFLTIKTVLSQEANNTIFFMMLGAMCALAYRARVTAPTIQQRTSASRAIMPLA